MNVLDLFEQEIKNTQASNNFAEIDKIFENNLKSYFRKCTEDILNLKDVKSVDFNNQTLTVQFNDGSDLGVLISGDSHIRTKEMIER